MQNGGRITQPVRTLLDAALAAHQARRLDEAETLYRQALSLLPDFADGLHLLGLLLYQKGDPGAGLPLVQRAIERQPNTAEYLNTLSVILIALAKPLDAESAARAAIQINPKLAEAHRNLGAALVEQKRPDDAVAVYRQAFALAPPTADAFFRLGNGFRLARNFPMAADLYRQAIQLKPDYVEALNNLGGVLRLMGRVDEALQAGRHAIAVNPRQAKSASNLATTLMELNRWDEAMAMHRRAIELSPKDPHFHWNYSLALLTLGDFAEGWREFKYRWGCDEFPSPVRGFTQPLWTGQPLTGQRILLYAEQGFGDTIQFARYAPLVAQLGAEVYLEVHPELHALLHQTPGVRMLIARGQPLPEFDWQCPLMSLPMALGTRVETIPALPARLWFDPSSARKWGDRLANIATKMKVGIAWAGRSWHPNDHNRSIPLNRLASLLSLPGIGWISLQKERDRLNPPDARLFDWTAELSDFTDTAALISQLDLMITVDTAVAHLAASLGKPTWILLPFCPDFRWLLNRSDSPWYPSVRLFRQSIRGDWAGPLQAIENGLSESIRLK